MENETKHDRNNTLPPSFENREDGLYMQTKNGPVLITHSTVTPQWVFRDPTGHGWGMTVEFVNLDNQPVRINFSMKDLNRGPLTEMLANAGVIIEPRYEDAVAYCLKMCAKLPLPRIRVRNSQGFFYEKHEDGTNTLAFLVGTQCIRRASTTASVPKLENVEFRSPAPNPTSVAYHVAGALAEWQAWLSPLQPFPGAVFAVCTAFASPLVALLSMEIGIFHLYGPSTGGKTTALQIAGSVWGAAQDPQMGGNTPTLVESWNTTANGLETMVAVHSGLTLILDELGRADGVGFSIYNLTAGKSKARMTDKGGQREQVRWEFLVLSCGEKRISEHFLETNARELKAGELIRANDIPMIELQPTEKLSREEIAQRMTTAKVQSSHVYGTAGPAFIQALLDKFPNDAELLKELRGSIDDYQQQLIIEARADGFDLTAPQERAIKRFALVATAGVLASEYGVLPFSTEAVCDAVLKTMLAWLSEFPSDEESQHKILENIRVYLDEHAASILYYDDAETDFPSDYVCIAKDKLLLFTEETFKQACYTNDARAAAKQLKALGALHAETGKNTFRCNMQKLGIERQAFYAVYMHSVNQLQRVEQETAPEPQPAAEAYEFVPEPEQQFQVPPDRSAVEQAQQKAQEQALLQSEPEPVPALILKPGSGLTSKLLRQARRSPRSGNGASGPAKSPLVIPDDFLNGSMPRRLVKRSLPLLNKASSNQNSQEPVSVDQQEAQPEPSGDNKGRHFPSPPMLPRAKKYPKFSSLLASARTENPSGIDGQINNSLPTRQDQEEVPSPTPTLSTISEEYDE